MIVLRWKIVLITSILISIVGFGIYYISQVNSSHYEKFNTKEAKPANESWLKYAYNYNNSHLNYTITNNQENPITTSLRLLNYSDDFIQTKNLTKLEYLKNDANLLIVNAENHGNYSVYELPSNYNMTSPVHSAVAQGFAILALAKAFEITKNATYLDTTIPLLNAFYVDVKDGGVSEKAATNGLWYEEYGTNSNTNSHGLTGMMYTLLALHDYYLYTNNTKSEYLFKQGMGALIVNLSNYDDGGYSYDDALSTTPTDPSNHMIQVQLLNKLYDITGISTLKEYRDKWKSYDNSENNIPLTQSKLSQINSNNTKIAIIQNTFTGGAYNDAFYKFYGENDYAPPDQNITNNNATPGFGPYLLTGIIPDYDIGGYNTWYIPFMQRHINSILPNVNITVLDDADIHRGLIFYKNGTNAYNLLILGHQEYVTQQEYYNLRSFVSNGGKIILLDGNIFYAEVFYDASTNSVTLIKGHGWEFDGNVARKSILERWFNETSQWVGGNYLPRGGSSINFTNNIFQYFNDEETYVNNPNDIIILDYGAKINPALKNITNILQCPDCVNYGSMARQDFEEHKIATYELNYGRGNVINLGIYAENEFGKTKFNSFFDSLVKGILSKNPSSYIYDIPQ